jgi:hypothetical protein
MVVQTRYLIWSLEDYDPHEQTYLPGSATCGVPGHDNSLSTEQRNQQALLAGAMHVELASLRRILAGGGGSCMTKSDASGKSIPDKSDF